MSTLLVLRILIVVFVALYIAAMATSGLPANAPREALDYHAWAMSQPLSASAVWGTLCAIGHLLDIVGLVLLFIRRRIGVYFIISGFALCLGTGGDIPYLQSNTSTALFTFVNIAWGAIVAISLTDRTGVFRTRGEA